MSAKTSKRSSNALDQIFGAPETDETTPSFSTRFREFLAKYYRPIAVLIAIVLLLGVALYIYQRIRVQNMQLAAQMLTDANDLTKLNNPELKEKVLGTPLEFDWNVKLLEKMQSNKKPGSEHVDAEGYIEEAIKFIDKYPRTGMAAAIQFNVGVYQTYLAQFDKAIASFEKVIAHPKAGFYKERAETELAVVKDYKADSDLDANFRPALESYAKARLATPTPAPTPEPAPSGEPPAVITPVPSGVPVPSPVATGLPEPEPQPLPTEEPPAQPE